MDEGYCQRRASAYASEHTSREDDKCCYWRQERSPHLPYPYPRQIEMAFLIGVRAPLKAPIVTPAVALIRGIRALRIFSSLPGQSLEFFQLVFLVKRNVDRPECLIRDLAVLRLLLCDLGGGQHQYRILHPIGLPPHLCRLAVYVSCRRTEPLFLLLRLSLPQCHGAVLIPRQYPMADPSRKYREILPNDTVPASPLSSSSAPRQGQIEGSRKREVVIAACNSTVAPIPPPNPAYLSNGKLD